MTGSSACTSSCSSSNWARFHSSPALSFCTTKASSDRSTFWPDITWKIQVENRNADANQVWEYWNLCYPKFSLQLNIARPAPPLHRPHLDSSRVTGERGEDAKEGFLQLKVLVPTAQPQVPQGITAGVTSTRRALRESGKHAQVSQETRFLGGEGRGGEGGGRGGEGRGGEGRGGEGRGGEGRGESVSRLTNIRMYEPQQIYFLGSKAPVCPMHIHTP